MKTLHFRQALIDEIPRIWEIMQQAILRRKNDASKQWQDGYPNPDVLKSDIDKGIGYVLTDDDVIVGYAAILVNDEPAYEHIKGSWLSNDDFVVVHRVAIADEYLGKGMAKKIFQLTEDFAISRQIFSIKIDTNYDNHAMLHILDKLAYTYCGEVEFRGGKRQAFEKLLR